MIGTEWFLERYEAPARAGVGNSPAETSRAADPDLPLAILQQCENVVIRQTILCGVTPGLAVPSSPVKTAARTDPDVSLPVFQ